LHQPGRKSTRPGWNADDPPECGQIAAKMAEILSNHTTVSQVLGTDSASGKNDPSVGAGRCCLYVCVDDSLADFLDIF
jgi:hypothetical protein